MDAAAIADAEKHLILQDPVLGAYIKRQSLEVHDRPSDYFGALCRSIVGQQVSVAAASAIFSRFQSTTQLKPANVMALSEDQIKAIGLSKQKTSYITDLASHFYENPAVYHHLDTQTDEQVIAELTDVKGIGTWTAQMFLMFTLGRPDIFAPDDIGLQRAMMNIYKWDDMPAKKELEAFAKRWSPYRTVASLHLWQSLNNQPD